MKNPKQYANALGEQGAGFLLWPTQICEFSKLEPDEQGVVDITPLYGDYAPSLPVAVFLDSGEPQPFGYSE